MPGYFDRMAERPKETIGPDMKPGYNYALQNSELSGDMEPYFEPGDLQPGALLKKTGSTLGALAAGQIFHTPQLTSIVQAALKKMPGYFANYLKRSPTKIHVGEMGKLEAIADGGTGFFSSPSIDRRFDPEIFNSQRISPTQGLIRLSPNLNYDDSVFTLQHELGHAAMTAAGREGHGIPGVVASDRLLQALRSGEYPIHQYPEEIAAEQLSGRKLIGVNEPITKVFDYAKYRQWLDQYIQELHSPPVVRPTTWGAPSDPEISHAGVFDLLKRMQD